MRMTVYLAGSDVSHRAAAAAGAEFALGGMNSVTLLIHIHENEFVS